MAKKVVKKQLQKLTGKNALSVFSSKRRIEEITVKNNNNEEAIVTLRSLSTKESTQAEAFANSIKPDSPFHGCGEFMCMLSLMLLNEDGTNMFESVEEGLFQIHQWDQTMLAQLLPAVHVLTYVAGKPLDSNETHADALEQKVEEVAKNSETAPAAASV